jgi:hypothetical protein
MARLQIVPLPTLTVGEVSQPEFLIVLDEVDDELEAALIQGFTYMKESTGARGILAFPGTIEVI